MSNIIALILITLLVITGCGKKGNIDADLSNALLISEFLSKNADIKVAIVTRHICSSCTSLKDALKNSLSNAKLKLNRNVFIGLINGDNEQNSFIPKILYQTATPLIVFFDKNNTIMGVTATGNSVEILNKLKFIDENKNYAFWDEILYPISDSGFANNLNIANSLFKLYELKAESDLPRHKTRANIDSLINQITTPNENLFFYPYHLIAAYYAPIDSVKEREYKVKAFSSIKSKRDSFIFGDEIGAAIKKVELEPIYPSKEVKVMTSKKN